MGKAKNIEKRLIQRALELNWDVDKLSTSVIIDENLLSTDDLTFYKKKRNIKESVATYIVNKFKPHVDPLEKVFTELFIEALGGCKPLSLSVKENKFNIGDYACEYIPQSDLLTFFKVNDKFKSIIDEKDYPNNRYKKITKAQFEYLKSEFINPE